MANDFTPSINYDLVTAGPDTTSNFVSDVAGGVVASVVDAGASIWNSLPFTPEADTADLLKGISNNALRVYEENPDTIHAASFIGGMFLPTGLAVKGMGALRAGVKGANWFTKAGREADLATVNKLLSEAKGTTPAYREATRALYAKSAVNQAIDVVAAEAALVTMMNKHPFMEDYLDDPVKNFGIGIALGGVLGVGIGHVADRFAVRAMGSTLGKEALDNLREVTRDVNVSMTGAVALQTNRININSLTNMLEDGLKVGKTAENDLTLNVAEKMRTEITLLETKLFDGIVDADMKKLGIEEKSTFMQMLATKPEMFGVDSISFLPASSLYTSKVIKNAGDLIDKPLLTQTVLKEGKLSKQSVDSVYYPNAGKDGGYASVKDAKNYAGAAAIVESAEEASVKFVGKNDYLTASLDNIFELQATSSAEAQAKYIGWIHKASTMKAKEFDKAILGNADNPAMSAMLQQLRTNVELQGKKIKVQDKSSVYKSILDQQVIDNGIAPEAYVAKVQKVINETRLDQRNDINMLNDSTIGAAGADLISRWRAGPGTWDMHIGATAFLARGYSAIGKSKALGAKGQYAEKVLNAQKGYSELYESASSTKLRAEFEALADKDGYVYLYRGIKAREVRGSSPVESMTTNYEKAAEFAAAHNGRVDLYKIHPSDIVGAIKDIKGAANDSTEILVKASARQSEATLDNAGKVTYRNNIKSLQTSLKPRSDIREVDAIELAGMIRQQKSYEIDSLMANGITADSIALKTNTPTEVVQAYMFGSTKGVGGLEDVLDALKGSVKMDPTTGNAINNLDEAKEALSVKNKPLRLTGNMRKNPYIEGHATLDNKQMADMNDLFVNQILLGSKSEAAKEFGVYMNENANMFSLLNQMLSNANEHAAGARFLNSFDFYARNMKDLGPVVSAIAKQRERISQKMIERVAKPIQEAMAIVVKDPVAVVEFNTFKNINDSLKGWRGINKDGYLVQKKIVDAVDPTDATKVVKTEAMEPVSFQGKPYQIKGVEVRKLLAEIQGRSTELRDMNNAVRKIKGIADVNDIGLWLPSFNPLNKFIAYVHNTADDTTQLIHAKSVEHLNELVGEYKVHLASKGIKNTNIITDPNQGTKIISKGVDQEMWSIMNGRMDPLTMKIADTTMLKSGSASSAIVSNNLEVFGEIVGGYEHYITAQTRNLVDVSMSDSMHILDRMSAVSRFNENNQPLSTVKKWISGSKDPAQVVKNTLLGDSLLGEYGGWKAINQGFETGLLMGQKAFNAAWDTAVTPLTKGLFGNKTLDVAKMQKMDYEKLSKDLEAAGVPNPWAAFDDALAAKYSVGTLSESSDISKRIVYAGNALAATVALRFGELAQPLVNIMSLPILTYLAKAQQHPEVFLGIQKNGGKIPNAAQVMYEGARASNSPMWKSLNDRWEDLGYFTPMISEANKTLQMARSMDKGLIPSIEKALDSSLVNFMSKPADASEGFVRRQTMFTGAVLAKHLYPGLDDAGITVFARDFMDKAVGNFHAAQRPVFFQGTLGVALGLFQTYSLTLGQSVYRNLELKNYKVLGKAALTQSGIFGTGSLPGFEAVSNQIGEYFSDDHVDLVTGTYRSLADPMAETILYGLPSQLGIGTHTRGDISPRFPGLSGESIVALNFASQTVDAVMNVAKAMGQVDASLPQAIGEAMSLQSLSRPLARGAEILTGYSKTQKGNTVQTPDEVWTLAGVGARILGTRPIAETKLRDAMHMNSFYNSVDSENRSAVVSRLRTSVRAGTLSEENVSEAALKYMSNGGTPSGWRSAINDTVMKTESSGKETLIHKLRPNSPLNLMIDMGD